MQTVSATEALARLRRGNLAYIKNESAKPDLFPDLRARLFSEGQHPYAVVVACSDSRVVPEHIFSAGLGELFVVRVAGNVLGEHALGSIEYALGHLGCPLVLILGHEGCGAVGAALAGETPHGYVASLVRELRLAIGEEKDSLAAARLNVRHSVERVERELRPERYGAKVVGAIYRMQSGKVEFSEVEI